MNGLVVLLRAIFVVFIILVVSIIALIIAIYSDKGKNNGQ